MEQKNSKIYILIVVGMVSALAAFRDGLLLAGISQFGDLF